MSGLHDQQAVLPPPSGAGRAHRARRLSFIAGSLLLAGGVAMFCAYTYISANETWGATVTGVATHTVNIHFDVGSDDVEIASYPSGMRIDEGDRVRVRVDEHEGNSVLEVLPN